MTPHIVILSVAKDQVAGVPFRLCAQRSQPRTRVWLDLILRFAQDDWGTLRMIGGLIYGWTTAMAFWILAKED